NIKLPNVTNSESGFSSATSKSNESIHSVRPWNILFQRSGTIASQRAYSVWTTTPPIASMASVTNFCSFTFDHLLYSFLYLILMAILVAMQISDRQALSHAPSYSYYQAASHRFRPSAAQSSIHHGT